MTWILALIIIIFLVWNIIVSYTLYKAVQSNFDLQDISQGLVSLIDSLTLTLIYDTRFLKSSLMRRLSSDIPEVADLNKQIIEFEKKIEMTRLALQQTKLVGWDNSNELEEPQQKNE